MTMKKKPKIWWFVKTSRDELYSGSNARSRKAAIILHEDFKGQDWSACRKEGDYLVKAVIKEVK